MLTDIRRIRRVRRPFLLLGLLIEANDAELRLFRLCRTGKFFIQNVLGRLIDTVRRFGNGNVVPVQNFDNLLVGFIVLLG